jgi:Cu/Zn superoxide dismutase
MEKEFLEKKHPLKEKEMFHHQSPKRAIAVLIDDSNQFDIEGIINFEELYDGGTRIYGMIEGAQPGLHGFHIHKYGNIINGCESMGSHYNPFDKMHGPRSIYDQYNNRITNFDRHLGDLGNL